VNRIIGPVIGLSRPQLLSPSRSPSASRKPPEKTDDGLMPSIPPAARAGLLERADHRRHPDRREDEDRVEDREDEDLAQDVDEHLLAALVPPDRRPDADPGDLDHHSARRTGSARSETAS
jgi:hypothetical protein